MAATPTFTAEQLAELLPLMKASDSVELKLTVPESDQRSAERLWVPGDPQGVAEHGRQLGDRGRRADDDHDLPAAGLHQGTERLPQERLAVDLDDELVRAEPVRPAAGQDDPSEPTGVEARLAPAHRGALGPRT